MKIALSALLVCLTASPLIADTLNCSLTGYRATPGLTASLAGDVISLVWDGDTGQEMRMRFAIDAGTPVIRELAVREKSGQWKTVATNARPEYRVVAGLRRMTNQQMVPLRARGIEITPEIIETYKWDAFHDAPLYIEPPPPPARGGGAGAAGAAAAPAAGREGGGNPPPAAGIAGQPGRPRNPNEIRRATAAYRATSCAVKTDGQHLVVSFPGVQLGMFAGSLQYTVYKGTNLIRQEVIARTIDPSVAYKYDTGLTGLTVGADSRVAWRDTSNLWQTYAFGGTVNTSDVPLQAANRTIAAEGGGASIAVFPPPHSFFWSRQTAINLGYNWYRKESETSFSLGIRQAEHDPEDPENFALYSARPNTDQRMPMYIYVSPTGAQATVQRALAFTHQDKFKALPGYQVMASHFHTSIPSRLAAAGSLDVKLPDFVAWKAAGMNIVGPVDGGRIQGDRLAGLKNFYEAARRHSDKDFLVMPQEESSGATRLGGHNDVLYSKPVFWDYQRPAGTPFMEQHPIYGKVYHVGDVPDMLELMKLENMIVFMPHPRSKGSTGWPDAMKDTPQFNSNNYRGVGMRWGMGLDGSETRLCEIRCQTLLDDMNNWVADRPIDLKYVHAIYDAYQNAPGDDIYANIPVNYIKIDKVPSVDDMTPIIDAMKRGDYFWTSGEVLITNYSVQGTGPRRTIAADVEWTFPLAFVEVVWGDGVKTDRQIISATDLPAFGKKRFEIPFDAAGKKWVRFAAWDTATNGAMVMPVRVQP